MDVWYFDNDDHHHRLLLCVAAYVMCECSSDFDILRNELSFEEKKNRLMLFAYIDIFYLKKQRVPK